MSRLLRGAALGTAILLSAAACTDAGAEDNGHDQSGLNSVNESLSHGDLYYAVYEDNGDGYTSKLLRWNGTADGRVETVLETDDTRLFHTATVTSDGAFVAYAEGYEDGTLQFRDLESGDTKTVAQFPRLADSCLTPAFAPGTGGELLVPGGGEVTIHYPEEVQVGDVHAVGDCIPQPAIAEGDSEPSIFYLDRDGDLPSGEIMFVKPNRETVDTDLGAEAAEFLGAEQLHELTVSPNGSQVCVEAFTLDHDGQDPYSRHGECQLLIDVATGEHLKHFDGEVFAVKYTGDGLVLRKDGELSYYPKADDLDEPAETVTEPEELAEAQLIAVTDA